MNLAGDVVSRHAYQGDDDLKVVSTYLIALRTFTEAQNDLVNRLAKLESQIANLPATNGGQTAQPVQQQPVYYTPTYYYCQPVVQPQQSGRWCLFGRR